MSEYFSLYLTVVCKSSGWFVAIADFLITESNRMLLQISIYASYFVYSVII